MKQLQSIKIGVIADTHVGSRYAVAPHGVKMSEGNELGLNKGQYKLLDFYRETEQWMINIGIDILLLNGDVIDGSNVKEHGRFQLTTDLDEQADLAINLLEPLAASAQKVYAVSSSGYHDARQMNAMNKIVTKLGGEFKGVVYNMKLPQISDFVVHIEHFNSGASVYREQAIGKKVLFQDVAEALGKLPHFDLTILAHWHWFFAGLYEHKSVVLAPSFQCISPYLMKKNYERFQPTIGGVVIEITGDKNVLIHKHLMSDIPRIGDEVFEVVI